MGNDQTGELSDQNDAHYIEHADALQWLEQQDEGTATVVVFDPPYAVGSPVRGKEDEYDNSCSALVLLFKPLQSISMLNVVSIILI